MGVEVAEELVTLFALAPYDAVAHRDGAARFDVAPLDEAADHHVAAGLYLHARGDVARHDQRPFEDDVAVADIHLLDAQHIVHLHAVLLLAWQAGAAGQQQIGVIRREEGALAGYHGAVLAMFGGQLLTGDGETRHPLGRGVAAHQLGAGLDGEDGAEVAHVDPAVVQLLRLEDPFGRGLHQPLETGVLAVDGGLALRHRQPEQGARRRLLGGQHGGGNERCLHPLADLAALDRLLQLFTGEVFAAPVGGDLCGGAHPVLLHHQQDAGIVALGDGHRIAGRGRSGCSAGC